MLCMAGAPANRRRESPGGVTPRRQLPRNAGRPRPATAHPATHVAGSPGRQRVMTTIAIADLVPAPVLFNPWKHHAGVIRQRVAAAVAAGPAALRPLTGELVVIGTELMDLYLGGFTPAQLGEWVVRTLEADG